MANIRHVERRVDRETDPGVDQIEGVLSQPEQVASVENPPEVSASVSDLMAPEKRKASLSGSFMAL